MELEKSYGLPERMSEAVPLSTLNQTWQISKRSFKSDRQTHQIATVRKPRVCDDGELNHVQQRSQHHSRDLVLFGKDARHEEPQFLDVCLLGQRNGAEAFLGGAARVTDGCLDDSLLTGRSGGGILFVGKWGLRPTVVDGLLTRDGLARVVGLLHEEKQIDKPDALEDGRPIQNPLPALRVGDEAGDDGREEVGAREEQAVDGHVETTFVREVDVGHADLAEGLDRRPEEALQNLVRDPLTVGRGVRCPDLRHLSTPVERRKRVLVVGIPELPGWPRWK